MGKKQKKEIEASPKDAFNSLIIESKNVQTVVLMLDSLEDEILLKACEAIYKFAEKGDENKMILLALGAVPKLAKLISHDDKQIHMYATMGFGVMATNSEVRKSMRQLDFLPSIIACLAPDDDVVVHELATLCLSSISIDFTSKVEIYEKGGLGPLIQLLSSPDPDVQKNSIECISNLVKDYVCRVALNKMNGIYPVLNLLNSEYPVIQQLALQTLITVSSDAGSRKALFQNEGHETLLQVLDTPEFSDLHADVLHVLANCLEEAQNVTIIRESGALEKFLLFLATSSFPEAQRHATNAITRSARNSETRNIFHQEGLEKVLVMLLGINNDAVKIAACEAVSVMCASDSSKEAFRTEEAIFQIVPLLTSDNVEMREAAALALANLTTANSSNASALDILQEINLSSSHKNNFSDAAAKRLLDHNAALKYCLTGYLSFNDVITDGFYDPGQIKPGMKVLTLEEHSNQEVNQHRPILLINVKKADGHQMAGLPIEEKLTEAPLAVSSRFPSSKANSKDKPSSKGRSRGKKEEEKVKEEQSQAKTEEEERNKPWECPYDVLFDAYLSEITRNILPLVSTKEQIVALAIESKITDASLQPIQFTPCDIKKWLEALDATTAVGPNNFPARLVLPELAATLAKLFQYSDNTGISQQRGKVPRFVSEKMGGPISKEKLHEFTWELHIAELKSELKSNIIPIGKIQKGIYYHRALLFKALADKIGISCSLVRGEYSRAWNEVMLVDRPTQDVTGLFIPPTKYIVDLVHQVGSLMRTDSPDAAHYESFTSCKHTTCKCCKQLSWYLDHFERK
ncbi:armadillo repeat-containing protein 3 [Rhincodon typus]|uniref:armadillo repeat-containing protein 3 n=1 Tax=Rhincodon typus TaxID=259920 RepID=UPI00202FE554|nr:armadillo repeat-containing protein 3 [Rhincodon typus]